MRSAEELYERGRRAAGRGRHAEARRLLERARADLPPGDLRARVEGSLAYVWSETGDPPAALDLLSTALGHPHLGRATRGLLHSQTALLQMLRGESDAALREFSQAIGLLDDPHDLGRAHLNQGGVHLQRGLAAAAAHDFDQARRLYREAGDEYGAAKAVHNLGYARFLQGDLAGALVDLAAAYPAFVEHGAVMTAMAEQDRAEVLMAAGLVTEGRTALRAAARAYGARRLAQRQAEAELALARHLLDDDPAEALAAARRACRRFEAAGAQAWRPRAEAVVLSAEVELGRRGPSLVARADRLAEELAGQGLGWAAATLGLHAARVQLRRGDLAGARARLATLRARAGAPLDVRLLSREVRASVAERSGRPDLALRHLRAGLEDMHAWQSSFGSLDLQTLVVGRGTRLGVHGLDLAVRTRDPGVLFEWSERARMLASRVQPVRAPHDEELAADLAELRDLAQEQARGRTARGATGREAVLRRRVRERAWQLRGSGEVADPCSLADLRAALAAAPEPTALVAHVVSAQEVVALVVTEEGATCVDLTPRVALERLTGGLLPDLDMAAADLPPALATTVRRELVERLGRLDALLVTPLRAAVGERRVVLTPSGVLAGVPWTLLPGLSGRPVSVAQSATSWLARRTTPLRASRAGFVAGPRVSRAEDEVRAAAGRWADGEVLLAHAADAASVSALASRVDVLHVAAHGRHSAENPMFSGLQLADGPWFGYDIDQLPAVPDVVLLSACEVGRSSVRAGEELIGMTRAWLHAGARCVVASAAAVNDETAYDVLVAVHEHLAAGLDPAAALARAVRPAGPDAPPAPFVCFA